MILRPSVVTLFLCTAAAAGMSVGLEFSLYVCMVGFASPPPPLPPQLSAQFHPAGGQKIHKASVQLG